MRFAPDILAEHARFLAARSSHWPTLRKDHLRRQRWCRYCGTDEHLEVHHIHPVHLYPDRELDPANLITLCMSPDHPCHLRIGHLGAWWRWNPKVVGECQVDRPHEFQRHQNALRALLNDGWAFHVERDGKDLVYEARGTCFGGDSDPDDNGITACNFNTRIYKDSAIVALPMDGRAFQTPIQAFHKALDGSPVPRLAFGAVCRLEQLDDTGRVIEAGEYPALELGPAKWTGNGVDLTKAAAQDFDPLASVTDFAARFRVIIRNVNARMHR